MIKVSSNFCCEFNVRIQKTASNLAFKLSRILVTCSRHKTEESVIIKVFQALDDYYWMCPAIFCRLFSSEAKNVCFLGQIANGVKFPRSSFSWFKFSVINISSVDSIIYLSLGVVDYWYEKTLRITIYNGQRSQRERLTAIKQKADGLFSTQRWERQLLLTVLHW